MRLHASKDILEYIMFINYADGNLNCAPQKAFCEKELKFVGLLPLSEQFYLLDDLNEIRKYRHQNLFSHEWNGER